MLAFVSHFWRSGDSNSWGRGFDHVWACSFWINILFSGWCVWVFWTGWEAGMRLELESKSNSCHFRGNFLNVRLSRLSYSILLGCDILSVGVGGGELITPHRLHHWNFKSWYHTYRTYICRERSVHYYSAQHVHKPGYETNIVCGGGGGLRNEMNIA